MANIQINFDNNIDSSISIGDFAYYCAVSGDGVALEEPQLIGTIVEVEQTYIVVDSVGVSFSAGAFILFSKPIQVEESGLKGYYANVTLENASKTYAELFVVSSEVVPSSK